MKRAFLDKILARLRRIQPEEVEAFFVELARDKRFLETGDPARYLGFLQSGGKQYPIDTLKLAGVDMTSPHPVESALELFAQRVEELAQLLNIDLSKSA
jgi:oligoendopeptidase F